MANYQKKSTNTVTYQKTNSARSYQKVNQNMNYQNCTWWLNYRLIFCSWKFLMVSCNRVPVL